MKTVILISLYITVCHFAFSQEWVGYGKGISYMTISENYIDGSTCDHGLGIKPEGILREGLNHCHYIDEETDELLYPVDVIIFGKNMDSVKIQNLNGKHVATFYSKENYSFDTKYHFRGLEFEIWNDDFIRATRYQINRFGMFNKSNENFEPKVNRSLNRIEMDRLLKLIEGINVKGLKDCALSFDVSSHANNYILTFYDGMRKRYSYVGQEIPLTLKAITKFIRYLE